MEKLINIPKQKLSRLYIGKELSSRDISKIYKCSQRTILLKLKKYNINIRPLKINIDKNALKKLYKGQKKSIKEISRKFDCSEAVILKRLHDYGIKVNNPHKYVYIPRNRLSKLYKNGLSIRKIANKFNCEGSTILRKMHKYRLKRHPEYLYIDIPKDELELLYYKNKKTSAEISKKYKCSYKTILNRLHEHNIKVRDISEAHYKYPKYNFSGNLIEKAYVIGFRLGDLHVRKFEKNGKILSVVCGSPYKEQIDLIYNLFNNYCQVHISKPNKYGIIKIYAYPNESFSFLLKKEDKIESWILRDNKLFFAFLAGYTDAEGSIGISLNNCASFRIGSCDKNILKQTKKKLELMGINSTFRLEQPKGTICKPTRENKNITYYLNKDFWRLNIYKKVDLLKLFTFLSKFLKHKNKIKAMHIAKNNIIQRNIKYGNLRMDQEVV